MSRRTSFILTFAIAVLAWVAGHSTKAAAPDRSTIVFVCLHGSVKSQMAAAHFNRIARERGLPYVGVSRGIEVDASIPTTIRDGLSLDGLAPVDDVPRPLTATEAVAAAKVVAFDAVPDDRRGTAEINYWSDVPPATKDYTAARDVILHSIDDLIPTLATLRPETLRGTEGQRSNTHRGNRGHWSDRVSDPATGMGDGALTEQRGTGRDQPF